MHVKSKILKKSKTATVITPKQKEGVLGWLEDNATESKKECVTLFKRVSNDFKTQEGTKNETLWTIGTTVDHPSWSPKEKECGEGKFHACSRAYFCDQFRDKKDDRYVAIEVSTKDMYAWKNAEYPHKIAFRKCKVLFECNKFGEKI